MSDTLKHIVAITGLAIGAEITVPHTLKINGDAVTPDEAKLDRPATFQVVGATTTTITVRNVNDATGDVNCLCEAWVPVERMFGKVPDDGTFSQHLTPQPFTTQAASVAPPYPPDTPVINTIYVRTTGSDATGLGTLASPYRTFKRAIRDVPHVIPQGYRFVVNVTDLGAEEFPVGYQLPSIHGTVLGWSFGDPSTFPFLGSGALTILATPKPFAAIPLADTTVAGSGITSIAGVGASQLATITVSTPRASWANDALKGAMLIGTAGSDAGAATSCVIYGSDATHIRVCNTVGAVQTSPQQDLHIVEPSATFNSAGANSDGAGFEIVDVASILIQGIKFTITGGGGDGSASLAFGKAVQPFIELCDVDSIGSLGCALQLGTFSSVLRSFLDIEASGWSPRRALVLGAQTRMLAGGIQVVRQTVFDGCAAIGPGQFATANGYFPQQGWEFLNCIFTGSTGDMAVFAVGGGAYSLDSVQIDEGAGDAIRAMGPVSVVLNNVRGTGSLGFGVAAMDGAQVRVVDDVTDVTGDDGDMLVGTLPVRTWADWRANAPRGNQYDLRTPFIENVASTLLTPAGDETTGANSGGCSGSRVYRRPNPGT